ncbi:MAG: hypothetical protein R3B07_00955 [Polyangiaceae bacterium]
MADADRLVEEGLELYGRGEVDAAIAAWQRAVSLDPGHETALEYLDAAGFHPVPSDSGAQVIDINVARKVLTPPPPRRDSVPPVAPPRHTDTQALERLLAGKRYEDALALLLEERTRRPDDPTLSRGIRLLKDRLLLNFLRRVGDLDQVPVRLTPRVPLDAASPVFELVDGIASLEDIIAAVPLGRFEALKAVCELLDLKAIQLSPPAAWSLPGPIPPSMRRAPTKDSSTQERAMSNIAESLALLETLNGFIGAALVDADSGMVLGTRGGHGFNLELAGALNTEVVRAKRKAMNALELGDQLEDILITLAEQYHIIRFVAKRPQVFIYLASHRDKSNLALNRMKLGEVDKSLHV